MKPTLALRSFLLGSTLLASAPSALHAADGSWSADAIGDWSTGGNWTSSTVADGIGFTATLSDVITDDRTINLDTARTIGNITASDTSHNYTISGGNILTLDRTSGVPVIDVTTSGRTLTIASQIAGSDGIQKNGAGALILSSANTFSGASSLSSGTLQLGNATSMGSSTLTMTSGTTLQLRNDSDTTFTAPIATAPTTGVTYNFDVNNAGSAVTGKKLSLGNLTFATNTTGTITNTINVTGGNGYTLGLGTISAPSSASSAHPVIINATTAAVTISKFSTGSYGSALQLQGGNSITLANFEMGSNGGNSLTVSGIGTVATLGTTTQTNSRSGGSAAYTLTSGTLNLTTTTSLANVRLVSGALSAPTFAINGGTLNNTSGSALTLAASPGTGTIAGSPTITLGGNFAFGTSGSTNSNDLNLGTGAITNAGNRTITFAGTGTTLTMGGTMTNGVAGNQTTTVNGAGNTLSLGGYSLGANRVNVIDGTGNVNITGVITQASGTSGLTYSGSGTLTISGNANTYAGGTTVNSGTVEISSTGKLYSTSTTALTTVNSGGTLSVYAWQYGANGSIGNPYFGTSTLAVNGGTIKYTGVGENSGNNNGRVFAIGTGGATLDAAGSGTWFLTRNASSPLDQTTINGLTLTGSGNGNHSNNLVGSGGTLVKSGSGTWTLTGNNTYSGATTVNNGTLFVSAGNINNTSSVAVNGGEFRYGSTTGLSRNVTLAGGTFRYNSSTAYSGALTFTSGTLAGTNMTGAAFDNQVIGTGKSIAPGNSPGTMNVANQTWAAGGTYFWEIYDAAGTAGTSWDLLLGTGTLDITASVSNRFIIDLTSFSSISPADVLGDALNFNELSSYSWLLADFASISGFNANQFSFDTTGFDNSFTGQFGISLGGGALPGNNTDLYLTYTAIPEPGAALLGGLGLLALLRRRRD